MLFKFRWNEKLTQGMEKDERRANQEGKAKGMVKEYGGERESERENEQQRFHVT